MQHLFFPYDLSVFPTVDKDKDRDKIIEATKTLNTMMKASKTQAKQNHCYYCGCDCNSFCNSHTVPAFCLRNIAENGKVFYSNTIVDLPLMKSAKGVNEAGTFNLICRECDSKIFQEYENPDNYVELPSIKMLAQIDMKNNLKNISKRLIETELYDIMSENTAVSDVWAQRKKDVSALDFKEYNDAFFRAKKHALKPFSGDYYLGYYAKLPYVVPVAFQGTIALLCDLEGNIINNLYNTDPKYKIMNMSLCIFPLKDTSIIMIFVEKTNTRYRRFFKQLSKLDDLDAQLSVINYTLFLYCEDYFLSPTIPQNILDDLIPLFSKTTEGVAFGTPLLDDILEEAKKIYSFQNNRDIPNLLSSAFALKDNTLNSESV